MTGIELRPMTADDFPAVHALTVEADAFDGQAFVTTLEELREELDDDHIRLSDDVRLAIVDERLVGYCYAYHLPSDEREERCYLFGAVAPAYRARGIGRTLMAWGIDRATELLRSTGRDLPRYLRVDGLDTVTSRHRLFARLGFTPVRWFEELLRPLTDLPPRRDVDGVRIVAWPEGRDDEIRHMKNLAFADHWGGAPTSEHHWGQMVRGYGSRPDLSFIAVDDTDRVVAHCLNKRYPDDDELLGRRDGWIDNLGCLPEWRGRGIASALIVESLHAFVADGLTHASIGVDADSPTGANRLYRALGFEPNLRSITHQIVVDGAS
jgi:mycothiol synthase